MPKCPICEKDVQEYFNDYMDHTMLEEQSRCKDDHHFYFYHYHTGSWEECLGLVCFHGHYTDTDSERVHRSEVYKMVLAYEKERYTRILTEKESNQ